MKDSVLELSLSVADVLSSLSCALDLTSGHPTGHARRCALIGAKVASVIHLDKIETAELYHAVLMKDAGCSSNAARMYAIFGSDEIATKRASRVVDWTNLAEAARYVVANTLPKGPLAARAARVLKIAGHRQETSIAIIESRCTRGADIANKLGLGSAAANCIQCLDEHWDGNGAPRGLSKEHIPLFARIAGMVQTLEVFATTYGIDEAYEILRKRSGRWFDPNVVAAAESFQGDSHFWETLYESPTELVGHLDLHPWLEAATESRIDSVCEAFAEIVDAKSPFTAEHSQRVSEYAVIIAEVLGLPEDRVELLRRAGLLHDIGKLAVPNCILDKPGKLDADEWVQIRAHPGYSERILSPIRGFERLAVIAGAHHERLDGQGYYMNRVADDLDLDMRIMAVADVYDALSAERPYRGAMSKEEVFGILAKDAGVSLDAECVAAIEYAVDTHRADGESCPRAA